LGIGGYSVRIFYFFGANPALDSGYSMKLWKIERRGNKLYAAWGAAKLSRKKRKAFPAQKLLSRTWSFPSKAEAKKEMRKRIDSKLAKGYERAPRRKPRT
jgi:predicted DNA-binding WGR domain protein